MINKSNCLIIFDFSGTLSIKTSWFGRKKSLINAFKASGLWDLGLRSVKMFWEKIISPTWYEGATTQIGYQTLLSNKILELGLMKKDQIDESTQLFTEFYLNQSNIEKLWIPILKKLYNHPFVTLLVVTDHYAEITNHISNQFKRIGFTTTSLCISSLNNKQEIEGSILIANSADMGCLKRSSVYWNQVKTVFSPKIFNQIIIIDDFGFNEAQEDKYSDMNKIFKRMVSTLEGIQTLSFREIYCIPFFLHSTSSRNKQKIIDEFSSLVNTISNFLKANIS